MIYLLNANILWNRERKQPFDHLHLNWRRNWKSNGIEWNQFSV